MSDSEVIRIPQDWNATRRAYPEQTIAQLFEAETQRRADATAVVFGSERISYEELNSRANRLASYIRRRGEIAPDTPVGICLERSIELIVALLAILKAGGAYVALDPSYPQARLRLMLSNAAVPLLITSTALRRTLPDFEAMIVEIDRERGEIAQEPDLELSAANDIDRLAYISYTSGSTGSPKGVAIPHRGVVRLVKAGGFAKLDADETFLQLAPVGFDASTFEIWGCLLNGGCLVVMPPGVPSLEQIGIALRDNGVTTLWLTAGLFNLMVDQRPSDLCGIRQLLTGGDVLSKVHVGRAFQALPNCTLINGYGPTENTTFTCCHTIAADDLGSATIPLGRPIGNTVVHILNDNGEEVGVGVTGEICIGGDGLARGYWRQPELTASSFVADPFTDRPGARLYKSGDLGRWREDGVIEFGGRRDDQVKISGYRVETAEIEAALRTHAGVRDAAVIARGGAGAPRRLVAYILPATTGVMGVHDWRTSLRQILPPSLIPSEFIELQEFPLTPSGKVDRSALPEPQSHSATAPVLPQTALQRTIAAAWQNAIGARIEIGVDDNFFELGGTSLAAVEVHAELTRTVGSAFPITALFQHPTVRSLSGFLDSEQSLSTDFAEIHERAARQRAARGLPRRARTT